MYVSHLINILSDDNNTYIKHINDITRTYQQLSKKLVMTLFFLKLILISRAPFSTEYPPANIILSAIRSSPILRDPLMLSPGCFSNLKLFQS